MVCRDNRFVRYYCAAQSVIRQAADTFVAGRFGGSEFRRGADFVAQGGWRGIVSSKERSAHLLAEKCASFKCEVRTVLA